MGVPFHRERCPATATQDVGGDEPGVVAVERASPFRKTRGLIAC